VIAVFFLSHRQELIDGAVDFLARRRDRASVRRTIEQVDTMLGQYMRAQSATAALRILQNVVISPRILGDRLQMEPITVFVALMAVGQIAGLLGIVLALPAGAVLRIL
jgi:predicted PurR-regulated permease PerM